MGQDHWTAEHPQLGALVAGGGRGSQMVFYLFIFFYYYVFYAEFTPGPLAFVSSVFSEISFMSV